MDETPVQERSRKELLPKRRNVEKLEEKGKKVARKEGEPWVKVHRKQSRFVEGREARRRKFKAITDLNKNVRVVGGDQKSLEGKKKRFQGKKKKTVDHPRKGDLQWDKEKEERMGMESARKRTGKRRKREGTENILFMEAERFGQGESWRT